MQNRPKQNHYEVLDVPEQATAEDIKKAYRKKALETHPDKNGNTPEATAKFQKVTEANSVLSDESQRKAFDTWLRNERAPKPAPTPSSSWQQGQHRHVPNPTRPTPPESSQHRRKDSEPAAQPYQSRTYTVRTNGMFSQPEPRKVSISREYAESFIFLIQLQIQLEIQRQIQLEMQQQIQQYIFAMLVNAMNQQIHGQHHHVDHQQEEAPRQTIRVR